MFYLSEFYMGNPPQRLRGIFDTGSADIWIKNRKTNIMGTRPATTSSTKIDRALTTSRPSSYR